MQEMKTEFLRLLHSASEAGIVNWKLVKDEVRDPNEDRTIYQGFIGDEPIEIELVSFQVAYEKSYEVLLARIIGLKAYIEVGVGTEGFTLVTEMIAHPKSVDASKKHMKTAVEKVQQLLKHRNVDSK
jgi:hypothetical protein